MPEILIPNQEEIKSPKKEITPQEVVKKTTEFNLLKKEPKPTMISDKKYFEGIIQKNTKISRK